MENQNFSDAFNDTDRLINIAREAVLKEQAKMMIAEMYSNGITSKEVRILAKELLILSKDKWGS